jgi:hypothetical protein
VRGVFKGSRQPSARVGDVQLSRGGRRALRAARARANGGVVSGRAASRDADALRLSAGEAEGGLLSSPFRWWR